MERKNAVIQIRETPRFDGDTVLLRNEDTDEFVAIDVSADVADSIRRLFE